MDHRRQRVLTVGRINSQRPAIIIEAKPAQTFALMKEDKMRFRGDERNPDFLNRLDGFIVSRNQLGGLLGTLGSFAGPHLIERRVYKDNAQETAVGEVDGDLLVIFLN
jgi:hypothetical protein